MTFGSHAGYVKPVVGLVHNQGYTMARKRRTELRTMCEREGCTDVRVESTHGGHYRITGIHPVNDKVVELVTSATPSCYRGLMNLRSTLRRQIREPV